MNAKLADTFAYRPHVTSMAKRQLVEPRGDGRGGTFVPELGEPFPEGLGLLQRDHTTCVVYKLRPCNLQIYSAQSVPWGRERHAHDLGFTAKPARVMSITATTSSVPGPPTTAGWPPLLSILTGLPECDDHSKKLLLSTVRSTLPLSTSNGFVAFDETVAR